MEFDIGRLEASEDGPSATSLALEDLWGILEHPHNVPIDARHGNYVGWIFLIRDGADFRQGRFIRELMKFVAISLPTASSTNLPQRRFPDFFKSDIDRVITVSYVYNGRATFIVLKTERLLIWLISARGSRKMNNQKTPS